MRMMPKSLLNSVERLLKLLKKLRNLNLDLSINRSMPGQVVILMVSALIEKNGKYLVLQRSEKNITNKNKWQLPEGKVRPGENFLKALKRELLEETSMILTDAKLFGIHSSILKEAHGIFRVFRIIFKCKTMGKIKLSKDHKDFKWVSLKEKLDFIEGFDLKNIISVKGKI